MKYLFTILFIYLLIKSYVVHGQTIGSVDNWTEYWQEWTDETTDEEKAGALYAELSYRAGRPFDLNRVGEDELEKLPFLSDRQIANILAYRKQYGPFVSLYELKNIEGLDFETIRFLISFVHIDDKPVDKYPFHVKNLFKYGSNDLLIRYDRCFQQKKGYEAYPDSVLQQYPNRRYRGEPFYHSVRYSYTFGEKIQAGLTAEKDPGEPFWNRYHKGYDYYSGHIVWKNTGVLKTLAIGDYKASFGQGLLMSHDFSPGKNAFVTQIERRNTGFRRHFSTNETDFFRGAAVTVTWKKIDISCFYSRRKIDAAPDETGIFSSIKTDGLHRVQGDWEKRRRVTMQTYGGHIEYLSPGVRIGVTALSYSFGDCRFEPEPKPYNRFYFRGKRNTGFSVNYRLKKSGMKFYGETACSGNGAVATLNALEWTPASYFSLLTLYRYYDRKYQAYYGNAFGQNGTVQNEQGWYVGLQWTPFAYWKVAAYADCFRFPWLKYGVDAPSSGQEYMVQVTHEVRANLHVYIRYKYRQKEKNAVAGEATGPIRPYRQQRVRMQAIYGNLPGVELRTSVDGIFYRDEEQSSSYGWMAAQSFGWKPLSLPFQADLYVAWFQTGGYVTRISSYEKNLLYVFNRPSLYGKGMRIALSFGIRIKDRWMGAVKFADTYYIDRERIGTGTEEIEGRHKTDLSVLLRWKF